MRVVSTADEARRARPATHAGSGETFDRYEHVIESKGSAMSQPLPGATQEIRPPIGAPTLAAAASMRGANTAPALGARRMPPVNRSQKTEFMDVPVRYNAPFGPTSAEWPIVDTYARLVWRADEMEVPE